MNFCSRWTALPDSMYPGVAALWWRPMPVQTTHEVVLFLMGSVMGALLHQRDYLPLHGSAIKTENGAALFLGTSSIGKSTIAAGFQKRGYPILADDLCAVAMDKDSRAIVLPGFPRLKLWADALKKLEVPAADLLRVRVDESFDKFFPAVFRRRPEANGDSICFSPENQQ